MVLGTDIRIAAEHAVFGLPEVRRGVIPFAGSMVRLPRQIGWCHAMELLLVGETIDAREAQRIGLVNHVVPAARGHAQGADDRPEDRRERRRWRCSASSRPWCAASGVPLAEGYRLEDESKRIVMASEDAREGPRAFMEKRAPRYTGR